MDALETEEAKLYKALDKLEAVIQHNESDIRTWLPLEYDLQQTYAVAETQNDPYLKELRDLVLADTLKKIEDAK
jgi:putative hydrolase of HD superfamily